MDKECKELFDEIKDDIKEIREFQDLVAGYVSNHLSDVEFRQKWIIGAVVFLVPLVVAILALVVDMAFQI